MGEMLITCLLGEDDAAMGLQTHSMNEKALVNMARELMNAKWS